MRIGLEKDRDKIKIYYKTGPENWDLMKSYNWRTEPGFFPVGFSDDGQSLYVITSLDEDVKSLREFDLLTRTFKQKIYGVDGYDIDSTIFYQGKLVGVTYTEDETKDYYFEKKYAALLKGLQRAFPNMNVRIADMTADGHYGIVVASSAQEAGAYYLLTASEHVELEPLGSAYPELLPDQLASVKPITYRARDGQIIHGYLTIPQGMEGKPMPFIVLPHSGPSNRDKIAFDWWVQFLSTRGYGVLQMNFRGSTGYGRNFELAGSKQWGRLMQNDVSDGLAWLRSEGLVKDNRVCIGGWNYGGYSALVGASLTPDLYRCAFSMAGIANVWDFLRRLKYYYGFTDENILMVQTDEREADAVSPSEHVSDIKIPILLMHGDQDFVVPSTQSKYFEHQLKSKGKIFDSLYFDDDNHYLMKSKNRISFLHKLEDFLAKNLGPGELPH